MSRIFAKPDSLTLADVIELVQADEDLSIGKRRQITRDIAVACRWFGLAPSGVIAHAMDIRPRFARLSPGGLGVSKKRIQNVRSTIKSALRRVDVIDGRSFKVPLTSSWQALLNGIESAYLKKKVRCFASLGSAIDVAPGEVDEAFSARLLEAIKADRLGSDPRFVHQNAVRAWNRLAAMPGNWPGTKLQIPRYRRIPAQPRPEGAIAAAMEAFLIKNATDDPYDLSAPIAPWKPSTVATYRRYLHRFYGLLLSLGHRPTDFHGLKDLVLPLERTINALRLMQEQNEGGGRVGASHIARLLGQVATEALGNESGLTEHEIADLEQAAAALRETADRLHKRNKVLGKKNRERLMPFRDQRNVAELFLLPFALMRRVSRLREPTIKELLVMQWALALMILTFCPLRISSLCAIRIDRHLVWSRRGMKGELALHFQEGELKGDCREILPLPRECARAVKLFLNVRVHHYRGDWPYLFPGGSPDKPKTRGVMSSQLKAVVFNELGYHVNPHLYRHIVHLVVLTRFPGAYAMISRVLTHSSLETAQKNYAYFDVELSMRAYQRLVRGVQKGQNPESDDEAIAYAIDREVMKDGKA